MRPSLRRPAPGGAPPHPYRTIPPQVLPAESHRGERFTGRVRRPGTRAGSAGDPAGPPPCEPDSQIVPPSAGQWRALEVAPRGSDIVPRRAPLECSVSAGGTSALGRDPVRRPPVAQLCGLGTLPAGCRRHRALGRRVPSWKGATLPCRRSLGLMATQGRGLSRRQADSLENPTGAVGARSGEAGPVDGPQPSAAGQGPRRARRRGRPRGRCGR